MRVPQRPPAGEDWWEIDAVQELFEQGAFEPMVGGRYRHWDSLRRLKPPPPATPEQWWMAIKLARRSLYRLLPLHQVDGAAFVYAVPDPVLEMTHQIDSMARGQVGVSEEILNSEHRSRYVVSSLVEEAITSSQLEGAATTRLVAKEMIRSGRPPRDIGERMILNNFRAMELIRDLPGERLTPELVLDLHARLTDGTLDDPEQVGRVQGAAEDRVRVVDSTGQVLHVPPPAEELPARMEIMCAFANGEVKVAGFMHPVVRSILLHFWLAYDHPFADGNGRTARALFYWSMLRQGYWLAEFLSISSILRKAPAQYGRSFLYTETDDGDTTYFVLYQLRVICRAIEALEDYMRRKMEEVRAVERTIRTTAEFNHRQLALLSHALRHPDARYTFASHAMSHQVVRESARRDLLDLESRGLLVRRKVGRAMTFFPSPDLPDRLAGV